MLQDPNVERYVENAIKPLQTQITKMKAEIKALREANKNFVQPDVIKSVCSFYMAGMDTSGKCNNCGKNQWEH